MSAHRAPESSARFRSALHGQISGTGRRILSRSLCFLRDMPRTNAERRGPKHPSPGLGFPTHHLPNSAYFSVCPRHPAVCGIVVVGGQMWSVEPRNNGLPESTERHYLQNVEVVLRHG